MAEADDDCLIGEIIVMTMTDDDVSMTKSVSSQ